MTTRGGGPGLARDSGFRVAHLVPACTEEGVARGGQGEAGDGGETVRKVAWTCLNQGGTDTPPREQLLRVQGQGSGGRGGRVQGAAHLQHVGVGVEEEGAVDAPVAAKRVHAEAPHSCCVPT